MQESRGQIYLWNKEVCFKFCEVWVTFRRVFFPDLILYGCLWMDPISDGLFMRGIHRIVGRAIVWVTDYNRSDAQAHSGRSDRRLKVDLCHLEGGKGRWGDTDLHWFSFSPHTKTYTYQDLYSHSPRARVCTGLLYWRLLKFYSPEQAPSMAQRGLWVLSTTEANSSWPLPLFN